MGCFRWCGSLFLTRQSIVVFLALHVLSLSAARRHKAKTLKCQQMQIPLCSAIGYNMTHLPNRFNQKTQLEAELEMNKFWPLVTIKCAADLKFFLCASYAPICEQHYGRELYPCRSICERVKKGCLPVMKSNGFRWPEALDCSKYPKKGDTLCMEHNSTPEKSTVSPPFTKMEIKPTSLSKVVDENNPTTKKSLPTDSSVKTVSGFNEVRNIHHTMKGANGVMCGCKCQAPFVYINASVVDGPRNFPTCVLPCNSFYFTQQQGNFVSAWLTILTILCLLSSLFTFLTYLIDRSRFTYPEKPMVFIALSYFMVAVGFVIRLFYGTENIACNPETKLVRYSSTGPTPCMAVFLIVYFFSTSSWLWWVIMSLSWFLAAGMKWSQEAIAGYSRYFHGIAWTVPTLKTMAALAMTAVDGDPVSGICFIGNHNSSMLTIFLIAPLLVYTMLGCSFLTAGILALFHIRRIVKQHGADIHKLEQLMIKVGVYSALYIIPSAVLIACYFYEHSSRDGWEKSKNCPCVAVNNRTKPNFNVYLLKYFMMLAVGISSGFWLIGAKTLNSWSKFCLKIAGQKSTAERIEKEALSPVHL